MTTINNSNNLFNTLPYIGLQLPNANKINKVTAGLASGNTTIYTAPSGRSGLVLGYTWYNNGVSTIIHYRQINISGTNYRYSPANSTNAAAGSNTTGYSMIFSAGESLVINTNNSGLTVVVDIIEFDACSDIFTVKDLDPAVGDHTLYTVPTGKTAFVWGLNTNSRQNTFASNDSAGSLNHKWYLVPSGGPTDNTTLILTSTALSAGSSAIISYPLCVDENQSIIYNLATNAAKVVWTNIIETNKS